MTEENKVRGFATSKFAVSVGPEGILVTTVAPMNNDEASALARALAAISRSK